jgi:hypothetical protein
VVIPNAFKRLESRLPTPQTSSTGADASSHAVDTNLEKKYRALGKRLYHLFKQKIWSEAAYKTQLLGSARCNLDLSCLHSVD